MLIRSFLEPEEELKRIYFYVSEPFTELEPRIRGNKKEKLEEYKEKNPKDYEKRVNKSGIIQSFNHEIAQQNQVELRVGWVKYKFEDISEEERHFGMEIRTNQERLDLRQKGIDTLLVHDIAKICYTATSRCVYCSARIPILHLCLKRFANKASRSLSPELKKAPFLSLQT